MVFVVIERSNMKKEASRHEDSLIFEGMTSISAVINGESVYSEEVVWFPKLQSDPDYHYQGIL